MFGLQTHKFKFQGYSIIKPNECTALLLCASWCLSALLCHSSCRSVLQAFVACHGARVFFFWHSSSFPFGTRVLQALVSFNIVCIGTQMPCGWLAHSGVGGWFTMCSACWQLCHSWSLPLDAVEQHSLTTLAAYLRAQSNAWMSCRPSLGRIIPLPIICLRWGWHALGTWWHWLTAKRMIWYTWRVWKPGRKVSIRVIHAAPAECPHALAWVIQTMSGPEWEMLVIQ